MTQRDPEQVLTEFYVLRAQNGCERSYRELFRLWQPALERFVLRKTQDPGAAEEVAQSTWVGIARGLPGLDDPACFPRWAFQIASRRSADWVRTRQRERRQRVLLETDSERVQPQAVEPGEESEAAERLRDAVRSLPLPSREVIHLFYEAELSVASIAAVLGIPLGTVKSRLFAAREQLKQSL